MKNFLLFFIEIYNSRNLIYQLSKKDFQVKFLGSYLGIFWAFLQPTITILIFWFVFQVGFKSIPVDNFPFILWLMAGMIPWFYFSDTLSNATASIVENSYLVKKIVFKVSILPVIKIISSMIVHCFFIVFLFILLICYGYSFSLYYLQVFYYLFSMAILLFGISLITASLNVFVKDMGQIIGMTIQFGFWLTPIFWSLKNIPDQYHILLSINPMFYIVEGYRDTFIYKTWFWNDPLTIYFWIINIVCLILGILFFKRLRPHFADVL